jgi:hypothetical protein
MEVTGIKELVEMVQQLGERYKQALAAALYQEAAAVMTESLKEVPVDVGRLRQSHYVAPPDNLDNPVAQAGYGAHYGVYVHERTDAKHNSPTKDHFLSDPLTRATGSYADRIAKRTKDNVQSGIGISNVSSLYPKEPKT